MAPRKKALSRGIEIVVGTPGRIIDHIERGNLVLDAVQFVVLDEADEMLSVGFCRRHRGNPQGPRRKRRQTMLFSATLTRDILRIAKQYQTDPVTVDLVGEGKSQAAVSVEHLKIRTGRTRTRLLADLLTVYNPRTAPSSSPAPSAKWTSWRWNSFTVAWKPRRCTAIWPRASVNAP